MQTQRETIYIIDAHNFLHRNYHALPKLSTSGGLEVGALYGFTKWLGRLMRDNPRYVAVCFDSPGGSRQRKELFPAYKANRQKPDDALITQLQTARELVSKIGFKVFAADGIEADDIIGFIAKSAEERGLDSVIVTTDKDAVQLLDEHIKLWPAGSAKEAPRGPEYVKEKYGVEQKYFVDYLAITGDSSDNIPGIAGVGPKTAAELINNFGFLEDIIAAAKAGDPKIKPGAAKKIIDGEADALLSKQLVAVNTRVPFDFKPADAAVNIPQQAELDKLFAQYEFRNMAGLFSAAPEQTPAESGVLFSAAPEGATLEEVKNKILGSFFIQTDENFVIAGADEKTFFIKETAALSPSETEELKTLCADHKILKISYDVKLTFRALGFAPEKFINCFDLRLAAYLLNPGADFSFNAAAEQFLNIKPEEKSEPDFLILQNSCAPRLKEILEKELNARGQYKVFSEMEIPLISVLLFMETEGVLVDKPWLENFSQTLGREITVLQADIDKLAGREINVNSPKQLGVMLFEQFKLPSIKKTKTGYSTDEESLQNLVNLHPIVPKILEYRANAKLKSTYVDNLIILADENSRVHTYLDQEGTVTGRLSSSSPNLQNIPIRTPKGRLLRRAFCAGPGNMLLSADYSQIDLRVLAHESQDRVLTDAFKEGGDIHTKTAAEVFHVMREMVSDEMRSSAKAINFGIIYGQGPMGLSQALGISLREAKEYIDGYFAVYKTVREWIDKNIVLARERGYVKTLMGHIRYMPEFAMGSARMSSFAQRAAINTIVQGGSADIIKAAMNDIYAHYYNTPVKLLLQIHDELIFEMPADLLEKEARVIKHKMENTVSLMVPLLAEAKAGRDLYEMEKLKL